MKKKTFLYWVLAVLLTLAAVVFQRMTGPTNPKRMAFMIENTEYKTRLPRSITIGGEYSVLKFIVKNLPANITPELFMRKYQSAADFEPQALQRNGDVFEVLLLSEAPAGKIEYYIQFTQLDNDTMVVQEQPVVARFKQDVPASLLIPHILLMFAAMLLSTLVGLMAIGRREGYMMYAKIMWVCLFLGGFVLGCLVQKMAFGVYWTGFPLGNDLTDNKTLFALLIWTAAIAANWRSNKRWWWMVVAAVFMLLVYCIPHSA